MVGLVDWTFLGAVSILCGAGCYFAGFVLYYICFYNELLVVREDGVLTRALLRFVNPIRDWVGKAPLWDTPQGLPEQAMVQVAVDCLSHIRRELARSGSVSARAASNAASLKQVTGELVADMVETLWNLQWARNISAKLNHLGGHASPDQMARIQLIEERDVRRIQRSFDTMLALASKLAELGAQVRESDLEKLLDEFREVLTELEEDALALEEIRSMSL